MHEADVIDDFMKRTLASALPIAGPIGQGQSRAIIEGLLLILRNPFEAFYAPDRFLPLLHIKELNVFEHPGAAVAIKDEESGSRLISSACSRFDSDVQAYSICIDSVGPKNFARP